MPALVPLLALCAAGYGAAVGSLLPRAAYRLAVPPQTPWRARCPSGHVLTGSARGWLGRAICPACVAPARPAGPGGLGVAADARSGPHGGAADEPSGPDGAVDEPAGPEGATDEPHARTEPFADEPLAAAPVYAAVCALVCAALALATGPRPELAIWLSAAPVAVLLAAVDAKAQRLPDILTLPLAGATAALLGLAALAPGAGGEWTGALLGGAVLAGGYFLLFLINPRGMGFGDVKLAVSPGLALGWYGWDVLFAGTLLAFLLAAAYGSALLLTKRAKWKTSMPFGPFMLLGTVLGLLLGGLST